MGRAFVSTVLICVVAAIPAVLFVAADNAKVVFYFVGLVLTLVVALRNGYAFDLSSVILLLLGPLGWFILLWRRENRLKARGPDSTQTTRSATTTAGVDGVDRLAKLAELRRSGDLTDAEFEIEKKRIIGR